jgi:murein DD-endopeptidase MepM/ murein hydrolase activator NlpD
MAPTPGRTALLARALLAAAAVATTLVPAPAGADAESDLKAAQRRANAAARELSAAQEELAHAEDAVSHLETRVARLDARVAEVRDRVGDLAVRLYVQGTAPVARLLRLGDAAHLVQVQQYSRFVAGISTDALRQYRADRAELAEELAALAAGQEAQAAAVEGLRRRQAAATAEVERLTRMAEQARAAREAEERARAQAAGAATGPAGTGPQATAAPAPAASASPAASGPAAPAPAGGGWVCPVQGPHAFSNDYGAPRGGGFTHQGIDLLAATGTPVVAHVSGVVTQRTGAVSGLAYFLAGDDGNRYFGAHLDSFGASGRVAQGTVIGTVGTTGDAAGGPPHLHFEMHPGGSGHTNPYSLLVRSC